ncbi:MAG TPA: hypothetical protein VFP39_09200 [Gemmatimonadales bacterium]|nr:hypothetical protein [Gemmatimonadales bacterium]
MLRSIGPGDEPALEALLVRHADFSMFLRSNSQAAGLVYDGRRAVLFAEREDAKRAYGGIGFRVVGEYGLVLFAGV